MFFRVANAISTFIGDELMRVREVYTVSHCGLTPVDFRARSDFLLSFKPLSLFDRKHSPYDF